MATRKPVASKVSTASFNPSADAIKRTTDKPAVKAKTKLDRIAEQTLVGKAHRASKAVLPKAKPVKVGPGVLVKGIASERNVKALTKIVERKTVVKAAKKPDVLKFRGYSIPINRKNGDTEEGVPTIPVKNVNDTIKLFEKLPKGCTWLADPAVSSRDTLNVYNRAGAYIAEVRIERKQ